jgi:hypothetical protein
MSDSLCLSSLHFEDGFRNAATKEKYNGRAQVRPIAVTKQEKTKHAKAAKYDSIDAMSKEIISL